MEASTFVVAHVVEAKAKQIVLGSEIRAWTRRDPDQPNRLKAQTIPDDVRMRLTAS